MTWLGIDLGTSSVKVVVVDDSGRVLDLKSAPYPTHQPEQGAAEQDPSQWWDAVGSAIRQLPSELRDSVEAIGLSGQMHGTVCLDRNLELLRPAIIWSDTRGAGTAVELTERIGRTALAHSVGTALAAGFQAVTLAWLKSIEPEIASNLKMVLLPKDYIRLKLTGELATDPSDAASTGMLGVADRIWSRNVLKAVGIDSDQMPPIARSAEVTGQLTSAALEHLGISRPVPVCGGGGDASLAALGTGVASAGQVMITLSSGAQVAMFSDRPAVDPALRVHTFASPLDPSAGENGWYIMGATLSAGTSVQWAKDRILGRSGDSIESCVAMASDASAGADGLIYVPYISGERTPYLDANARGAFIGLTASHDQRHILRAVIEGTVFAICDAWDVVTSLATAPSEVIVAGGGARSRLWVQVVADMLDRPVRTAEVADASAVGAAVLAAAMQSNRPASQISREWSSFGPLIEPDLEAVERYARLRPAYQAYYQHFAPHFKTLRSLSD